MGFELDEKKFRVHLQLHTTHNKKNITEMWSKLLKIPETQFYPPTLTQATNRMKRLDYQGTCSVRYHDFTVFHQIKGIYEKFSLFMDKRINKK